MNVERGVNTIVADVEVRHRVKDGLDDTVQFTTDDGCCYCSFGFQIGKNYLFYANAENETFTTSTCSRSNLLEAAGEDLEALDLEQVAMKIREAEEKAEQQPPASSRE